MWDRFAECREAAAVIAANSSGDEVAEECAGACEKSSQDCADGCVRGCTGGQRSVVPQPPAVDVPIAFVAPCPDAGGYRGFGWTDPENPDRIHLGHDYNAPAETHVRAIADGIVVHVHQNVPGFGGTNPSKPGSVIWIRHRTSAGEYFHTLYGHTRPCKQKGQWVIAGDVVGTIIPFHDGAEYTPHLHLGIWQSRDSPPTQQLGYGPQRKFVDPIEFMETYKPGLFRR